MSHEELNSAHQVLGKVIQCLLTLHAIFYINFFARINVLAKRVNDRDVILGFICIIILTVISSAAIGTVRKWSYRLFYTIHVVLATLFLPLAYFHVHHIRPFILQSAGVYIVHLILRVVNSRTRKGSIILIPGTSLVQVKIPLNGAASRYKPGQHLYLSLPRGHRGTIIPNFFLRNPFTVASLPQSDGEVVLIARVLKGNTASYANIAREANLQDTAVPRTLPLKIEGPYGAASHLPDFTNFDRILLVAGGVGATFIIPVWRSILAARRDSGSQHQPELRLVWAVRTLSETSWALPIAEAEPQGDADRNRCEAEIYVTGVSGFSSSSADVGEGVELAETDALIGDEDEKAVLKQGISVKRGRPDLHEITTEVCSGHIGRFAILVCGPAGMSKQMRREVKRHVAKGKDIFWHAEEFGL
jgi:NAD(P)H-flavin reductase